MDNGKQKKDVTFLCAVKIYKQKIIPNRLFMSCISTQHCKCFIVISKFKRILRGNLNFDISKFKEKISMKTNRLNFFGISIFNFSLNFEIKVSCSTLSFRDWKMPLLSFSDLKLDIKMSNLSF